MTKLVKFKYTGDTPGADSSAYTIFDTTVAFPGARYLLMNGFKRFVMDAEHSHLAVLDWYKSSDRGVTWDKIGTENLAAPAANQTNIRDFLVSPYDDWRLVWTNGGTAQDPFRLDLSADDERGVAD